MIGSNTIKEFFDGLSWIFERKSMNSLWPVGLSTTSLKYGARFAFDLEESLTPTSNMTSNAHFDFPTSSNVVALSVLYGMYTDQWTISRSFKLLNNLFDVSKLGKYGSLINANWTNLILESKNAWNYAKEVRLSENKEDHVLQNKISGTIFALSEALFFCNHRVLTEKHGPYINEENGECLLIRSMQIRDIPNLLWPELKEELEVLHRLTQQIHIYSIYRSIEVKFDMYSNIMHNQNVNVTMLRGGISPKMSEKEIAMFKEIALTLIKKSTLLTSIASVEERCCRLIGIMYYACRHIFSSSGRNWQSLWKANLTDNMQRIVNTNFDDKLLVNYFINNKKEVYD